MSLELSISRSLALCNNDVYGANKTELDPSVHYFFVNDTIYCFTRPYIDREKVMTQK